MAHKIAQLSVRVRILTLIVMSILGLLLISGSALIQAKKRVIDGREDMLRNVVDQGVGIIARQYLLAQSGIISETQAKKIALDELASLPHGSHDAFFAFDNSGVYILAPEFPEIVGKNLSDLKDSKGTLVTQELRAVAQRGGGVAHYWYPKSGGRVPLEKMTYAEMFRPWGWVLAAGVYNDDVDADVFADTAKLCGATLALLLTLLVVGLRITRSVMSSLGGEPSYAAEVARQLASNDLTAKIKLASGDQSSLLYALNETVVNLRLTIERIQISSTSVAKASQEIAIGNRDLSTRTEGQAASLEETAASLTQLTETVKQNVDNAQQASILASNATGIANEGNEAMKCMMETIELINDSSTKISEITGVIEGIAFQTNILALNAAVEAARAGEQGRGFAVVASEVRSLAQRSATAAKEIKELITTSVSTIKDGAQQATHVCTTMEHVKGAIERVSNLVGEIAIASEEQGRGIAQANQAVLHMDAATQQNAALVEQAAAAAYSLEEQAVNLKDAVAVFKVSEI
ncbi:MULTISPECIES: methyl-accepting chemotaxis protein [unclassified Burkholderia]|uniref:methyl-accepting chemotaxis protein n=1 Tax=unclassified Burkholderia TaxID=2613784 RepID=UPI000F59B92B|nr:MULTISPECIES: methyl-accepting chemotaxis protein [unclassified Burkholderia]RQS19113.1 methyl-accepting chemotaxis protein [Burkholderia sp. Bp8995]RQS38874.1 methyl-accepting chemotaxis protein [Burkholderia sp. Bp8989]